jgi:hypothetical protein
VADRLRAGLGGRHVVLVAGTGALLSRLDLDFSSLHGAEPLLLSGDHVYFAALEKLFAFGAASAYDR